MHRSQSSSRKNLDQQRTHYIVEIFLRNFGDEMKENPKGWRGRFRKMVANEFAFYRGSAVLFYRDMLEDLPHDRWLKKCPQASRVFIHGDLHAENFGTYIDRYGLINFDVNDFDEGYIGPFTWDVKRLLASINLIAHRKAFSDKKIARVLECLLRAYLDQIDVYCRSNDSYYMAITSENTEGAVNKLLKESRLGSKEAHLNSMTTIENYERKFCRSKTVKDVDDQTREQVLAAFDRYVQTIPEHEKKSRKTNFQVKDIVARTSPGIGSAGRISYNLLLQGSSQALESDVILFMKPATRSAVATVSTDREVDQAFQHDGLRTVLCCYAMHAVTSKWLGYTTFNQMPMLVDEVATHSQDFDWENVNDFREMAQTAEYLGKAMAKIHCVADMDSIEKMRHVRHHTDLLPAHIIPRHTERTLRDAIGQNNDEFINEMISFAMFYGRVVRRDHALFFEAFRNEQIPIIDQFQNPVDSVKPGHIH